MYNSKIIIALDFTDRATTIDFLSKFKDEKLFVKIGMELFYKEGLSLIEELKTMGHNIFLDLKLYDIPTTVSCAIRSIGSVGVDFLTVHTSGGQEMLDEANKVATEFGINLLGVTILTSQEITDLPLTTESQSNILCDLAERSQNAGIFGIICAGPDIPIISQSGFRGKYVTPGIRLKSDDNNDQKRVATPDRAIANGSDFLVIGRSITKSADPVLTYQNIKNMIGETNV